MSGVETRLACRPADYKADTKPIWCPGCGDYHVLMSFTRAFAELGLPPEDIVVVSGIGCSSRIPAYTNCCFHGVRALALRRPEGDAAGSDRGGASGDGDGYSIGSNHFLMRAAIVDMTI